MKRHACSCVTLALLVLPMIGFSKSEDAVAPALNLVLKPHANDGKIDYVEGQLTIERPDIAAGATLVRMPLQIVSIPTPRYDGDALKARDGLGVLELRQKDEPPTPTGIYRQWLPARSTSGDVTLTFKATPRVVTPTTRGGPLFDLRTDGAGIIGAGITFLPLPNTQSPYRFKVKWDLADLPAGSQGVWTGADDGALAVGPPDLLAYSFFAAGPMRRYPLQADSKFGMYWFSDLPFDAAELGKHIQKLHGYMADFFHDPDQPYRVFIRKNANRAGGGTALPGAFTFGWNASEPPTLASLRSLLAHEMTHNWPLLEGEHGDTAWYSEGAAEFYSILLSYRAGEYSPEVFLREINERANGYYTNPHLNVTNSEAAKIFWTDWSAQRVPYGRGFMYLAQVDAQIRAKSGGKRSLDDIIVPLVQQRKEEKRPSIEDWLRRLTAELGPSASTNYEAMVAGKTLIPPPNSFAPCFKPVKSRVRPLVLGVAFESFAGERKVVKGLVKGSAAEAAGLRDGDEILEFTDFQEAVEAPDARMKLKIRRGGEERQIEYVPRGEFIDAYQWERVPSVPDAKCKV
jgi:hypothetical protein